MLSYGSSLVSVIQLAILEVVCRSAFTDEQVGLDLTVGSNAGFDKFQGKQQEAVLAALGGEALFPFCTVPLQVKLPR